MKRREFITLLGGAAAAWPLTARAQQGERVRRIGVLLPAPADDPEWQVRVGAFLQALALLGWPIGRNVRIDTRWATTNAGEIRRHAAELAALVPDVILAGGTTPAGPLLQATRTVPIVFTLGVDPVGAGFVDSLARPGGNITGITLVATDESTKRLEFIKQRSANIVRVAALWDTNASGHQFQMKELEPAAPHSITSSAQATRVHTLLRGAAASRKAAKDRKNA